MVVHFIRQSVEHLLLPPAQRCLRKQGVPITSLEDLAALEQLASQQQAYIGMVSPNKSLHAFPYGGHKVDAFGVLQFPVPKTVFRGQVKPTGLSGSLGVLVKTSYFEPQGTYSLEFTAPLASGKFYRIHSPALERTIAETLSNPQNERIMYA